MPSRSKYEYPARIQTLLFDRRLFSVREAKDWANRHGFRYGDVEETEKYIRLRQFDPSRCAPGTYGQREIKLGVRAVFCGQKNPPPLLLLETLANPEETMRIHVHNPRRHAAPLVRRDVPVVVVDKTEEHPLHNPRHRRHRRRNPRRRHNPYHNPRRRFHARRRRRNPLLPPASEWIELATDGAGAVIGGFFSSKISEMFLKEYEGNRIVAAIKRMAIGFLGMAVLRPFGRFGRMFAVGAAVSALQPLIVPYIQIGPFAPGGQPQQQPQGTSGIYPFEQTVLPGLAGIYGSDTISASAQEGTF
jgi:hypothetical protein